MNAEVSIVRCEDYDPKRVREALLEALAPIGGLDFVRPGMTVAVKVNLLTRAKPERAVTVHPAVVAALCALLVERGARVVVGDSPGGPFNAAYLSAVYTGCGMNDAVRAGASLNDDFGFSDVSFSEAVAAKELQITDYLLAADAIVDLCKVKTHGLMAFTGACKNLFGAVPGTRKTEYHYRYQSHEAFGNMLVDIAEFLKPCLSVADGVIAMEGNGPSGGTPRFLGAVMASKNPHALDLAAAHLIGLNKDDVPTLRAAHMRGLIPESADKLAVYGELSEFAVSDFKLIPKQRLESWGFKSKIFGNLAAHVLASRPLVYKNACVGCGECKNACPADAIAIEKKLARIDREKCVRCFCCQEFCPKSAIQVHRPFTARLMSRSKK
ncbi:MAG: DUF362 domain-containing protein [Clostridiaceae bacterium]|nr:DUF362 domain-containing protein [Eubacteriales bacterium]